MTYPLKYKIQWFDDNAANLLLHIFKKKENKTQNQRLKNKIISAQEFIRTHDKEFYKEITYLLCWSCLNEFMWDKFTINRNKPSNVFLKHNHTEKIVDNSKCMYYRIKAKPKNNLSMHYGYIYRKKSEPTEAPPNFYQPSFLINVYLHNHAGYLLQFKFSYLSHKRNKLTLTHDDERAIRDREFLDTVNIDDCIKVLKALIYLFNGRQISKYEENIPKSYSGNIKNIRLGKIKTINEKFVTLYNQDNSEISYNLNDNVVWKPFCLGDEVEIKFDEKNKESVSDIVFLF